MLKLKFYGNDNTEIGHYIFGLSRINIDRMLAGHPIMFEGKDVEMPNTGNIMIMFGETEEAMQELLEVQLGIKMNVTKEEETK